MNMSESSAQRIRTCVHGGHPGLPRAPSVTLLPVAASGPAGLQAGRWVAGRWVPRRRDAGALGRRGTGALGRWGTGALGRWGAARWGTGRWALGCTVARVALRRPWSPPPPPPHFPPLDRDPRAVQMAQDKIEEKRKRDISSATAPNMDKVEGEAEADGGEGGGENMCMIHAAVKAEPESESEGKGAKKPCNRSPEPRGCSGPAAL